MNRPRRRLAAALALAAAVPAASALEACARHEQFGGPPLCVGMGCPDAALGSPDAGSPGEASAPIPGPSTSAASSVPSANTPPGDPAPRVTPDIIDQGIEVALRQQALKYAQKGALPESQVLRVDLAEGQKSGMVFNLQPNTCYTFLAAGVPGVVSELEVKLLLPPFFTMEAGKGRGQLAAIGRVPAPICPISPIAIPYRVEVTATKGGGRVGLMVFAKGR
ncbi:MAG: hypothetical protein IPQ09_24565 [Myxococcales bacterium]|nr:hypothetical protein [Myxococcales bacterium]HQY63111.1 hypothetical protein [Polyangiaceae bacterium]